MTLSIESSLEDNITNTMVIIIISATNHRLVFTQVNISSHTSLRLILTLIYQHGQHLPIIYATDKIIAFSILYQHTFFRIVGIAFNGAIHAQTIGCEQCQHWLFIHSKCLRPDEPILFALQFVGSVAVRELFGSNLCTLDIIVDGLRIIAVVDGSPIANECGTIVFIHVNRSRNEQTVSHVDSTCPPANQAAPTVSICTCHTSIKQTITDIECSVFVVSNDTAIGNITVVGRSDTHARPALINCIRTFQICCHASCYTIRGIDRTLCMKVNDGSTVDIAEWSTIIG